MFPAVFRMAASRMQTFWENAELAFTKLVEPIVPKVGGTSYPLHCSMIVVKSY